MIAIPNMELPPWCGKCSLQDGEICYAINENDIGSGLSLFDLEDLRDFCIKRRDDCPLIEIVRCKGCKWCEKSGGILWCNIWHDDTNGLNFCSYAERRADE